MKIKDINPPSEVHAIGKRKLSDRPWVKAALGVMAVATIAGALHNADINPTTMSQYRSQPQEVTATVMGKVMEHTSVNLKGGENAWQPIDEVDSSMFNLVLSVPGQAKPVMLAVSADTYHSFCQHEKASRHEPSAERPMRSSTINVSGFGGCNFDANIASLGNAEAAAEAKMDTVQLTITKGVRDGTIQVESFQGVDKVAQSRAAKRALMKETIPRNDIKYGVMG